MAEKPRFRRRTVFAKNLGFGVGFGYRNNTNLYNPLLNIQHDAGRGAVSVRGLVVLVRHFSHAPICCNEVRFESFCPNIT